MNNDFSVKLYVNITMVDYLKGVIFYFEQVVFLTGTASSLAADHLYTVEEECGHNKFDEKQVMAFHHAVAQLLFASPRERKYIHTTVSLLTTRVHDPDEDSWKKLKRLILYVRRTINMPLILRADSLTIIKWWVEASYAAHPDIIGHTGVTMTFGR